MGKSFMWIGDKRKDTQYYDGWQNEDDKWEFEEEDEWALTEELHEI